MSTKGRLLGWLGGWVLAEAPVRAVERLGDFVWVGLGGAWASLQAGDKVQVLVGAAEVRTWTPIPAADGAALLVALREADTPGMRWVRGLAAGSTLRFVGPQRSLRPPAGPLTLVGDETSVAVAAALRASGRDVRVVLEVEAGLDAAAALPRAALADAVVLRRGGGPGAVVAAVAAAGAERAVLLTGGDELVKRARAELRAVGRAPAALRTYWVQGRAGLD